MNTRSGWHAGTIVRVMDGLAYSFGQDAIAHWMAAAVLLCYVRTPTTASVKPEGLLNVSLFAVTLKST